jgi:hypothetical protein
MVFFAILASAPRRLSALPYGDYTDEVMTKFVIIAAFAVAAVVMIFLWANTPQQTAGPDRNVPGATTGQGRNSLLSK